MKRHSCSSNRKSILKCLNICKKMKFKVDLLEKIVNCSISSEVAEPAQVEKPLSSTYSKTASTSIQELDISLLEMEFDPKYIGYMTICSSVQTSGRRQEISFDPERLVKKDALGGATLDVACLEKYLLKLGPLVHRQAKYEYSAESLSASPKDEFLNSLSFFYDNIRNDSCLLYYSGHGMRDTSLVFETAVENYHIMYEDIVSRWRTRNNTKNKNLFILLDCCYSGSWVIELFRNGDFREVSIQASSTYDQTSNDLGPDVGSLFTALLTKENGLENQISLSDLKVTKGMNSQTPMSFCSKRGVTLKIFNRIGFNSWTELISNQSWRKPTQTSNFTFMFKEVPCLSNDLFESVAVIISKEAIVLEGELLGKDILDKKTRFFARIKRIFTSNKIGCVSIWTKNNVTQGIFFREHKAKRYAFRIPQDLLAKSTDLLRLWLTKHDSFHSAEAIYEPIDEALNILTEISKNNLVNHDEYIDDNNDIDYDSLKIESLSPLESLSVSGKLDGPKLNSLIRYLGSGTSALKSLKLENCTCEILDFDESSSIESIYLEISQETPRETFVTVTNKIAYCIKSLFISFTNDSEALALTYPLLFSNFPFSTKLVSLSISNIYRVYYDDILSTVSNSFTLTSIFLENCDFQMCQSNLLIQKIFSKTCIVSVSLISSNLSTMIEPHQFIQYLNLSRNKLISMNVKSLLKVKFVSKYSIDLSYNLINSNLLPDLSLFLRNNKNCEEFNLSGNHFSHDILSLVRINLLGKCAVAVLSLCQTDLSNCDIKNLSELLNKAKQLRHLSLKGCNLTQEQLLEVMNLVNEKSVNSITSVDISFNKIKDENTYHNLRRKVKNSKSLQRLVMISCVDIKEGSKPLLTDGFLTGPSLCEINYSYWKAVHGFDVGLQVSRTIKSVTLKGFSFCSSALLNLGPLEIDNLEVDNDSLHFIIMPQACISLKVNQISKEFRSLDQMLLSKVQSLCVTGSNSDLDEFADNMILQAPTIKELKTLENIGRLETLVTEDTDEVAIRFISQTKLSYPNIEKWETEASHESTKNQLGYALRYTSNELLSILADRKFLHNHKIDAIYSADRDNKEVSQTAACLSLIGNCFSFEFIMESKLSALEILELNSVYLKGAMSYIETIASRNLSLKVLLIKDSEVNTDEINSLCKILKILRVSIEELHLVNTFIDSREVKPLLAALNTCTNLATLNFSGNTISKNVIFEFVAFHNSISTIILRDCAITKDEILQALGILSMKSMKKIDLSGIRLNELAIKAFMPPSSKWNQRSDSCQDFTLELGYSTKSLNSHCTHQMQMLHLNQINFDMSSWLICKALRSIICIPLVKLTHCLEENSFMNNFYLLSKKTQINYLDLSGNLLTDTNTYFVIAFIKNQIHGLNNPLIRVNLSNTNLEDKSFEKLYDFVCSEEKIFLVSIDLSHNKLTSISKTLISLLHQVKRTVFGRNLQSAFTAELSLEETKEKSFFLNETDKHNQSWKNLDFERTIRSKERTMAGHQNKITTLAKISDDLIVSGSYDCTIKLWELSTATCLKTLSGHKDYVTSILKLNDNLIVSGSYDCTIKLWELSNAICVKTINEDQNHVMMLLKINDELIMAGLADGTLKLLIISTAICLQTLIGHQDSIFALIKHHNFIVSGSKDCTIRLWELSTSKCLKTFTGHSKSVTSLLTIHDDLIASGSFDYTVKLWEVSTSVCLKTLLGHVDSIWNIVKINDSLIASGSGDKTIKVWDINNGACIKTLTGHLNSVSFLINVSRDLFISGSFDKTIKLWDASFGQFETEDKVNIEQFGNIDAHQDYVSDLIKINDDTIASASYDCCIKLWQVSTATCIQTLSANQHSVSALIKMNDDLIVSGSSSPDNCIKLWQLSTTSCLKTLIGHKASIWALIKISENLFVSGSADCTIKLWDIGFSASLKTLIGHHNSIWTLFKISEDLIISGSSDNTIKLWGISSAECFKTLTGHTDSLTALIKLNDNLIASGSYDCTIKLWKLSREECLTTLSGHEGILMALLKISDDLFLSGSFDNTIKLWSISTTNCVRTLTGHHRMIRVFVKFNEDVFFSGSGDKTIKMWKFSNIAANE